MEAKIFILELIDRAQKAQKEFETYSQQRVDMAVRAVGKIIYDNAEELAKMAVDETKIGVYQDKIYKNKGKSMAVWNRLKDVKSRGIIRYIEDEGIAEVAKPIGVIGAVTPMTNPVITPMHNAMIALKGGNALIICPHPRAKNVNTKTVEYMRKALAELNMPQDLIQCIEEPTVEISALIMKMCDTCISTGGPAMVNAAYSSGRPAYGVGPGNVQVLIDRDVDMNEVVNKLITGRTYDNGILCTCEQSAICPSDKYDEFVEAMQNKGAYYVKDQNEIDALRKIIFPEGNISRHCIGTSPAAIAAMADINIIENTRLLLVKVDKTGKDELLSKEKLCPVMVVYSYDKWEDAVKIAKDNLLNEGKGHSMSIHSNTKDNIEFAASELPASRFMVNQVCAISAGGSIDNSLNPTATLGCGSWGNNSISDNLWFNHLINISKIAYTIPNTKIPTDEEIWAV